MAAAMLSMLLDYEEFKHAGELVAGLVEAAGLPIIESTGEAIVTFAQEIAPEETGELRDSIKVQGSGIDERGPWVDVGSTEPYAMYQEFGTEHNAPHPFMRPAIAAVTGAREIPTKLALAPRRKKTGG